MCADMCASTVHVIAPHPPTPPQPHPKKPLRTFAENGNLHGVQAKIRNVQNFTGSPITPPPEIRVFPLRTHHLGFLVVFSVAS